MKVIARLIAYLFAASILLSACSIRTHAQQQEAQQLTLLVGTYTSDNGSRGIYTYRFNQETGLASTLSMAPLPNPSYLAVSDNHSFVYAVSEEGLPKAAVYAFELNAKTGALRYINKQLTDDGPCYVATDGARVVTANYGGGSMSVFALLGNGSLQPLDTLFKGDAFRADPDRQASAHVHCAVFSPDKNYLFVSDFSADRILRFTVSEKQQHPTLMGVAATVAPGSGPRHLVFAPKGNYAYLINEISGRIYAFRYTNGNLNEIQTIAADTIPAKGSADIHLSPDGRYLYASNRLKNDGLAIFEVNAQNGTLAKVGYQLTGKHPRNFYITPNGKFLLVACRDDNIIQIFRRDMETGLLTDTKQRIRVGKPSFITSVTLE